MTDTNATLKSIPAILDGQHIYVDRVPDVANPGPKRLRIVSPDRLNIVPFPCIVLEVDNSSYMLDNPRVVGDQLYYDNARKQW